MTDTIGPVTPARIDQQLLTQQLVECSCRRGRARRPGWAAHGADLSVLETALEAQMSEHVGYDAHEVAGRDGGNCRNGTRPKTVLTEIVAL